MRVLLVPRGGEREEKLDVERDASEGVGRIDICIFGASGNLSEYKPHF